MVVGTRYKVQIDRPPTVGGSLSLSFDLKGRREVLVYKKGETQGGPENNCDGGERGQRVRILVNVCKIKKLGG